MDEIIALRARLKAWEIEFFNRTARKPSKDDIDMSSDDIKAMYKSYSRLKSHKAKLKSTQNGWDSTAAKPDVEIGDNANCDGIASKIQTSPMGNIANKLWTNLSKVENQRSNCLRRRSSIRRILKQLNEAESENTDSNKSSLDEPSQSPSSDLKPMCNRINDDQYNLPLNVQPENFHPKQKRGFTRTAQVQLESSSVDISPVRSSPDSKPTGTNLYNDQHNLPLNIQPEKFLPDQMEPGFTRTIQARLETSLVSKLPGVRSSPRKKRKISRFQSLSFRKTISPQKQDLTSPDIDKVVSPSSVFSPSKSSPISEQSWPCFQKVFTTTYSADNTEKIPAKKSRLIDELSQVTSSCVYRASLAFSTESEEQTRCERRSLENSGVSSRSEPHNMPVAVIESTSDSEDLVVFGSPDNSPNTKKSRQSPEFTSGHGASIRNSNFRRLNLKVKRFAPKGSQRGVLLKKEYKRKLNAKFKSGKGSGCFRCGANDHWIKNCPNVASSAETGAGSDSVHVCDSQPSQNVCLDMAGNTSNEDDIELFAIESVSSLKGNRSTGGRKSTSSKLPPVKDRPSFQTPSSQQMPSQNSSARSNDSSNQARRKMKQKVQALLDGAEICIERSASIETGRDLFVPPLLESDNDLQMNAYLQEALDIFGYSEFRTGQKEVVQRLLSGKSTLAVLPTGHGKSVCYQMPAYLYRKYSSVKRCIALVISPLVSLMEDQLTSVASVPSLSGVCLNHHVSPEERASIWQRIENGEVDFLLISPEALVGPWSHSFISRLPPISFVCIDEVHCVSEWSHNFRPAYLQVCQILREQLNVRCFLGLTATATTSSIRSICEHLRLGDYRESLIRLTSIPSHLRLSISRLEDTVSDNDKSQAIVNLLKSKPYCNYKSIIIYCSRQDYCETLCSYINTTFAQIDTGKKPVSLAEVYHAGRSAQQRKLAQQRFMSGKCRIIVATVAFGMGINKADIDAVIHHDLPGSFENYVQEIGRAGRQITGSNECHCHLFVNPSTRCASEALRHIYSNATDFVTVKKLLNTIFKAAANQKDPCSNCASQKGRIKTIGVKSLSQETDIREEVVSTLLCYIESMHPSDIRLLQPTNAVCTIHYYCNSRDLDSLAENSLLLAAVLTLYRRYNAKSRTGQNAIVFNWLQLCAKLNWETDKVHRELLALEWLGSTDGMSRKSPLKVQFSELSYRFWVRCGVLDEEIDVILENLTKKTDAIEKMHLQKFHTFRNTLLEVCKQPNTIRENVLRRSLSEYFSSFSITGYQEFFLREYQVSIEEPQTCFSSANEQDLRRLIRSFIEIYSSDHKLTGRVIARILHGISSPLFPAIVWGKVRRFWRQKLDVDFQTLLSASKNELVVALNLR